MPVASVARLTALLVVGACLVLTAIPAGAQSITEFAVPTTGAFPFDITAGPDGNLWFTENAASNVARITPSGVVTEFPIAFLSGPLGIAPDGMIFFTEPGVDQIGRIDPLTFAVTEFAGLSLGSLPNGITAGPDRNLWFTETTANAIGRMTPVGIFTEFPTPTFLSGPEGITAGSDGNVWFAEGGAFQIGRINPLSLMFTEFGAGITAGPSGITAGPDGNLWFTEPSGNQIGRITPAGAVTEFGGISPGSFPIGIAAGPDGNLWFTEQSGNRIGRITTAGVVTEFALPTFGTFTNGITAGRDCNMWFTEPDANQIGRVNIASSLPDSNRDGIPDPCEILPPPATCADIDGDGVCTDQDNCPNVANSDQSDVDEDHVGDACDNCVNDFNPAQSDLDGNGKGDVCDSNLPSTFVLKRVRLHAKPPSSGMVLVKASLDTTEIGGVNGLRLLLKRGFATEVRGGGLPAPLIAFFPRCLSVIDCSGSGPETASFTRRGQTNVFNVTINYFSQSFPPPLSPSPVQVTLSLGNLGGIDRRDAATACRGTSRGRVVTCKK